MVKNQAQEYRGKIINMGDSIRGWIPSPLIRLLGGTGGDYVVFHLNQAGKVKVSISRSTASEKRKAVPRKTKSPKAAR
jgi:hypothetical protein